MKSPLFLRAASLLTLIHAVLHTMGAVFGEPDPGPASVAVAAMKANRFQWMGNMRSYWDFHLGLAIGITIFLTLDAIVLWLLASLAKSEAARLRPIIVAYAVAYLLFALNSYVYIFPGAVITEIVIALCLAGAFVTARPARSTERA